MDEPCPICRRGKPSDILAELGVCWATGSTYAPLPGYVCIVAKKHVVEPFELEREEAMAFWEDVLRAAHALQQLLHPSKLNYEIHGNTLPHLHLHIYPRFEGDPYAGKPIDGSTRFHRTRAELQKIADALRDA